MTPRSPSCETSKHVETAGRSEHRSRRFRIFVLAILLMCCIVATVWWWRRPIPTSPPMPSTISDDEVQAAVKQSRQRVLEKPDSAERWGELGMILLAHLFAKQADFCFAEASRLDSSDPMWYYGRGLIAAKSRPKDAIGLLKKAVAACRSQSDHSADMSLQLADAYLERGKLDEAERIYDAERKRDPKNHRAAYGLGVVAKIRGDKPKAIQFLTIAQASPYAKRKATSHLAAVARRFGDNEGADRYEKQAEKLPADKAWPDPLLDQLYLVTYGRRARERHAAFLESKGRFAEAANTYLQQIEKQPMAKDFVGAGINLARLRNYDRALPLLRAAIELDPKSAHAHYTLALVLFARAEREKHESPNSPQPGKWFREVVKLAKRTAELKPDDGQAYLFWGLSLKHLGDSTAAIEPLRKGVTCLPNNFELQFYLGEALTEARRPLEAKVHLHNAARIKPLDPRLASAFERLRKKK